MKNYKPLITYFKRSEGTYTLAIGMLIAGFLCLWLGSIFSYVMFLLSVVLLIGGFALMIYSSIGRADASALEKEIKENFAEINFDEFQENNSTQKRLPKEIKEEQFSAYHFHDGVYFKKLKNGATISSEYSCSKMIYLVDAFYIKTRVFSFVEDKVETSTVEIPFSSVEKIVVEHDENRYTYNKNSYLIKSCYLTIYYDGGKVRLPRTDDIYTDEMAENLNRMIEKMKQ